MNEIRFVPPPWFLIFRGLKIVGLISDSLIEIINSHWHFELHLLFFSPPNYLHFPGSFHLRPALPGLHGPDATDTALLLH